MSGQTLLAWSLEGLGAGAGPVKVLAVVGGAALGGLLIGAFVQLLARGLTAQRLPPWPLRIVRLLGAVLVGWLVALWLFGGGGGGLGGPGGWGFGSGTGTGEGDSATSGFHEKVQDKGKDKDRRAREPLPARPDETLQVEVLGDPALKKIAGAKFDPRQCYRIPGRKELYTLKQVEGVIRERLKEEPPLRRIEIVVYSDSPGGVGPAQLPDVADLDRRARDLTANAPGPVRVDLSKQRRPAPVE
jgi:hypothetical protein